MTDRFDIAIVGAGLIGASLAFGLRSFGDKLVVLDDSGIQSPSRANFGLIWVQGKGERLPEYGDWTLRSARAWPRLADELQRETGIDVALVQPGGLHVCLSRDELEARADYFDRLFAQPAAPRYEVTMLDREALLERLPRAGPSVVGGSWCPHDGHCNPLRLLRALHAAMRRAGVVHRAQHRVIAIEPAGARFRLVTAQRIVEAERIVLAAGLANARLAQDVGLHVPLRPNKGQIIALERVQPLLPFPLDTIRQTDEGVILIGDSHEDRTDDRSSFPVLGAMSRRAIATFPALAQVRAVRAWAALRVMSPDGAPIYQPSSAHPGAFVVNAHSGLTLAAAHAYLLAPALADGVLPASLAPYRTARFDDVRTAA